MTDNCQRRNIEERLASRGLTDVQKYWLNHVEVSVTAEGWRGSASELGELSEYMMRFFEERGCEVAEISMSGNLTGEDHGERP